jgi:hypothetical protein
MAMQPEEATGKSTCILNFSEEYFFQSYGVKKNWRTGAKKNRLTA